MNVLKQYGKLFALYNQSVHSRFRMKNACGNFIKLVNKNSKLVCNIWDNVKIVIIKWCSIYPRNGISQG